MVQNTKKIIKSLKKSTKKLKDWNKNAKLVLEKSKKFTIKELKGKLAKKQFPKSNSLTQ